MRSMLDEPKLRDFMAAIGNSAEGPGRIYLVGGSTALLLGVRAQTIDIDIKLDPEPKGVFESIARLKESLSLNVELASPDQFIPPLPGWQGRSEFIGRWGQVDFFHYDFYAQALSKILRGHDKDLSDAKALVSLGKVVPSLLIKYFLAIQPDLLRYPAINPHDFESRVNRFVMECDG